MRLSKWKHFIETTRGQALICIIFLTTLLPLGLNVVYLNKYSGFDESFRLSLSAILICTTLSLLSFSMYSLFKKRHIKTISFIVASLIVTSIFTYTAYVNYRVYHTLSNLTIQTTLSNYELVSLVNQPFETYADLEGTKIGKINIDNSIINQELDAFFETNDLTENVDFVTYQSTLDLVTALYNQEVDAMLINEGYETLFKNQIRFEDIEDDTRELAYFDMSHLKDEVQTENEQGKEYVSLTEAPFSVLLMGVDSEVEGVTASARADTLILATINPKTLSVTMTSIPRDTYTPITCFNYQGDKITHANNGGKDCVIDTVSELFDVEIPYYAMINFKGFVELIDAIGGIEVDVPYSFSEQNSDREFGDSMIHLEEGVQVLNGEEALALARHRKTLPNGDLGRAESQQLVINASLKTLLTKFTSINEVLNVLDVLGQNIETNFSIEQITSSFEYLVDLLSRYGATNPLDYIHIKNMVLSAEFGNLYNPMYGLELNYAFPYQGAINDAKKHIYMNLELIEPDLMTSFNFNPFNEVEAEQWVKPYYYGDEGISTAPLQTLVPDFVANRWDENDVLAWANENNISVTINWTEVGDYDYDYTKAGLVSAQNIKAGMKIDNVNQIELQMMGYYKVPNFNNPIMTQFEIETWAAKHGVIVKFLEPVYSETVPKGEWMINELPGTLMGAKTELVFTMSTGTTVPETICNEEEELIDGVCQPKVEVSCEEGEELIDGVCQPKVEVSCEEGEELIDGVCQPKVEVSCEEGEELIDGVCQPKVEVSCEEGEVLIDGVCQQTATQDENRLNSEVEPLASECAEGEILVEGVCIPDVMS